jgi:4-hydroxy-3-methylbut-2-en-1-yl diphosphate synthase IspG/GcpE
MVGVQAIAEAAKREIGAALQAESVRVSCPSCGRFMVAVFTLPVLLRDRCERCHVDVIALVGRGREVLAATEQ